MIGRNESQTLFLYSAVEFLWWINTHMHACLHHHHTTHTRIHTHTHTYEKNKHTFIWSVQRWLLEYQAYTHTEICTRNWASALKFSGFGIPTMFLFFFFFKKKGKTRNELIYSISHFSRAPIWLGSIALVKNHFKWHLLYVFRIAHYVQRVISSCMGMR